MVQFTILKVCNFKFLLKNLKQRGDLTQNDAKRYSNNMAIDTNFKCVTTICSITGQKLHSCRVWCRFAWNFPQVMNCYANCNNCVQWKSSWPNYWSSGASAFEWQGLGLPSLDIVGEVLFGEFPRLNVGR